VYLRYHSALSEALEAADRDLVQLRPVLRAVTLIPWRDGPDDRRRLLWDWVRPSLDEIGWPLITAPGPDGPFNRSAAINQAATLAGDWDVALIGDSDTIQQPGAVHEAVELAPEHGLVIPWTHRIKLNALGTDIAVRRGTGWVNDEYRDGQDRTSPFGGGGPVVVSRDAFDLVGGFDERFVGYGNEDLAFRAAVETLFIENQAWRVGGMIWHLYHKPARFVGTSKAATPQNTSLWNRYQQAWWKPYEMTEVLP